MLWPRQPVLLQLEKGDRKSTRLNSSHVRISYAVFCLKKKKSGLRDVTEPTARFAGRQALPTPSANTCLLTHSDNLASQMSNIHRTITSLIRFTYLIIN